MINELSSLLTTIASASASFVAILGGFIASKLIAVNGEREAVDGRLQELKYEIELKQQECDSLQEGITADDALDFIREHASNVANLDDLSTVYETDEQQLLEYDELEPYWTDAIVLARRFHAACKKATEFNDDDIPCELAAEVKGTHFDYEVCSAIAEEVFPTRLPRLSSVSVTTGAWYERDKQRISNLRLEIASLKIHEEQCKEQRNGLKKPRGMKRGLAIFALFSLFNIIQPLVLSTIPLGIPAEYNLVRFVSIALLLIGLIATFWYLAWLLKWKTDKASGQLEKDKDGQ